MIRVRWYLEGEIFKKVRRMGNVLFVVVCLIWFVFFWGVLVFWFFF